MSRQFVLPIVVLVSLGCEQPGDGSDRAERSPCHDLNGFIEGEIVEVSELPWPREEVDAPAAGGPTLTSAEYEYISGSCPEGVLRFTGTFGEERLSAATLEQTFSFFVLADPDLDVDHVDMSIDGDAFEAEIFLCGNFGEESVFPQAWMHIRDSEGRGSNAVCVTMFAEEGVPIPDGPLQGV